MHPSFQVQRRVEFCETDAAGMPHFSMYFQYMEQAEHALLRHLGLSVSWRDEEGMIGWPRVHAQCDYLGAVRFEDLLNIAVCIERLGDKSVTYLFEFKLSERLVARGKVTAVCCRLVPEQPMRSISIPAWMAELLRTYVAVPPSDCCR